MEQMVLVIETALLHRLGRIERYTLRMKDYLDALLSPTNYMFLDRTVAEHHLEYKQLIPYVVLRYRDSVFGYIRGKASSESRLLGKRSIGIGGHIEVVDCNLFSSDIEMYLQAAQREVEEEVNLQSNYSGNIVAVINDDSTNVGKVHLGIMHIWDLAEPKVTKREGLITQSGFVSICELKANLDELETWSQIALQVLEDPHVAKWQNPKETTKEVCAKP